ncbi:hypothetical protein GGI07_003012 [Coemansia sp. Benny D115]|nr:hypothetical protein GGI07_003012 [Coemansia sp. Benny D115]
MGEGSAGGGRSTPGNLGNAPSPLRIFTRPSATEPGTPEDLSPLPRGATNALLSSAFSKPYRVTEEDLDDDFETIGTQTTGNKAARAAPRLGRHGAHYNALPTHWRESESGSSGIASPVTPEGSSALQARAYVQAKAKAFSQSPSVSPRMQVGALREAFGSASSLDWPNDRPGSAFSMQGAGEVQQVESPVDLPTHGGRFPPALSSIAAPRPGAQRSALGVQSSGSGKQQQVAPSVPTATESSVPPPAGEDIVRKYLGLQRRTASATGQGLPANSEDVVPPVPEASSSSSNMVYRRAVSSGDLPALEGLNEPVTGNVGSGIGDSRNFLTPDLVESPLEALVRRLTIELFQLYVREDRKKAKAAAAPLKSQQSSAVATMRMPEDDEYEGFDSADATHAGYVQQFRLGPSMRSGSTTPAVTMDGYFTPQNSITPAENPTNVTASATGAAATSADTGTGTGAGSNTFNADNGSDLSAEPRPRPRHRLVQRTWMEEALIKARRVSTIDENAEQSILEGLAQASAASSPAANANVAQFNPIASIDSSAPSNRAPRPEAPWSRPHIDLSRLSDAASGDKGHVMSPRGFYRARDPAAPNRRLPSEHQHQQQQRQRIKAAALSISPARASLLRAVGRRQSVRLQPGKGQIVVAETGTRAPGIVEEDDVSSITDMPDMAGRAKRANSLPGLMQVPETREVSYAELQRRAARPVQVSKTRKPRARLVHRAERVVRGGSKPGVPEPPRKKAAPQHKRTGSRADLDQQLVRVELPPPVPLRVRREQVRIVLEPLIIVRPPLQGKSAAPELPEQRILRVHNQLLGAQAVLSRHNSLMRSAIPAKALTSRNLATAGAGSSGELSNTSASAATPNGVAKNLSATLRNSVRNEALDVVMLDNALYNHIEDDEKLRMADAREKRRRDRQQHAQENSAEAEDSESGVAAPWRNARRRSTLRRKGKGGLQMQSHDNQALGKSQTQGQGQGQGQGQAQTQRTAPGPTPGPSSGPGPAASAAPVVSRSLPAGRRLLLHGPAFRISTGIMARADTYLFLFTDMLVVTTRLGLSSAYTGLDAASMSLMAPPSSDMGSISADNRYKVHIAIPLSPSITSLKTVREGGSKRLGEDDESEEKRLVRQEERIRRACLLFEKNTSEAVVYLIHRDIIDPAPDSVASFLHRCTALSRRQLGCFLGAGILGENLHENPTTDEIEQEKLFHRQIWIAFLDSCNIDGVPIDEALRSVLFYVRLPNNHMSISVLLEILALEWFTRNIEHGQSGKVYVPDSQELTIKLVFAIMMLNTELHNPLLRGETQPDAAYRDFLLKFRASVVDDPAFSGKRKGNVLRKRDQPRVVTIMEVPTEQLKAIYDRVLANRLVSCSDARPMAPEFEIDWIRDPSDINSPPLTDEQIEQEIDEVYCDPGFRDGVLFNASSDRLPAKLNIEPAAWLRVTIRIPEPDPRFSIRVRVLHTPADLATSSTASAAGAAGVGSGASEVASILPVNWLNFRSTNQVRFIIRPQMIGHFTLHFVYEGSHARRYHPIPSRTMVVEGAFMRHTVQINWRRGEDPSSRARHMFGLDSLPTKTRWVQALETALASTADVPEKEIQNRVEKATRSLTAVVNSQQSAEQSKFVGEKSDTVIVGRGGTIGTVSGGGSSDHTAITTAKFFGALGVL